MSSIRENVQSLLKTLPPGVELMAVIKMRTAEEVLEAIDAGIRLIGGNYAQETALILEKIGRRVPCHMIGHLQRNKVKKAIEIFDCIETLDSVELAQELEKRCTQIGKVMPVLVEINSGREPNKTGVYPEQAEAFIRTVATFPHLRIQGLMTMGPFSENPEDSRPYFRETKTCFDHLAKLQIPNVEMKTLSMGMSDSYQVAIEEGATRVRIGTKIFGPREK